MPAIELFIPDTVLGDAILEQLQFAGLGSAVVGTDFAASLKADDVSAILLDEAAADKKILKSLSDAVNEKKKPRVFLLGKVPKEWDSNLLTETFSKPLRLGHIIARLQFYLQATPRTHVVPVLFGPYRFEPHNRQVVIEENGVVIRLTEKETALLEQLGHSNAAVTRENLLATIWGYSDQIDTHTLETHIYQLRRKLDPQGTGVNWLVNEQGSYRLNRDKAS